MRDPSTGKWGGRARSPRAPIWRGPAGGRDNAAVDRRVPRRDLLGMLASGAAAWATACSSDTGRGETNVVDDPTLGKVYQWEKDDLLVLVSGLQPSYQPGDEVRFELLLNNQRHAPISVRVRTKLLGRGQQAVVEAPVVPADIASEDVLKLERTLRLPRSLPPGDYTLEVELPPWQVGSDQAQGAGGALTAPLTVAG
jgi:hypothetical protein